MLIISRSTIFVNKSTLFNFNRSIAVVLKSFRENWKNKYVTAIKTLTIYNSVNNLAGACSM
jgi:hypothetical protein